MRIPIATKLIGLTLFLLLCVTIPITLKSTQLLQDKIITREATVNLEKANAKRNQVDNILNATRDKLILQGALLGKASLNNPDKKDREREFQESFQSDSTLVGLEVWKIDSQGTELLSRKIKQKVKEEFQLSDTYFYEQRKLAGLNILSVKKESIELRQTKLPNGRLMISMAVPLAEESNKVTHVVIADYYNTLLQSPFSESSIQSLMIVDKNGKVLAQSKEQAGDEISDAFQPLIEKALSETLPQQQTRFIDESTNSYWLGAFVKSPIYGVTTFSEVSEKNILEPAVEVRNLSYRISGHVLSISILFIFWFSMSITGPIEKLASLIKVVSKGNFDVKARRQVQSQDEVGDLAKAFDKMTDGLKERDKVKALFGKFHGVSVAEDLLQRDIAVGGSSKEVTVFFSDIRGFTAFSENRSPEEVVVMLNEYFALMVKIINKHGGIVDKFIGDAIMAVWGTPKATSHDTENALHACLEMRKALADFNERRLRKKLPIIKIGMGLHTGKVISGTIGSDERMEYTVIGDTVNIASRIESSTKSFGVDLLISESVLNKVGENFWVDLAGPVQVKGKSQAMQLFKVLGTRNAQGENIEVKTEYSQYEPEEDAKVKIAS